MRRRMGKPAEEERPRLITSRPRAKPPQYSALRRSRFLPKSLLALVLRLKGHRVLAKGYKTPVGVIDVITLKGGRLAFIEVRRRTKTLDRDLSLPAKQRRRLIRAAQYWLAEYPQFRGLDIAFEVVLTAPLAWPRYITYPKLTPRSELHGR